MAEDEPGNPVPPDTAAREAYSRWWRHKHRSAAEQGVYPVGADGLEIGGEALASWLRSPNQSAEE
jgi:hypothetical protein